MRTPNQAAPVVRRAVTTAPTGGAVIQSGCCIRVLGQCVHEHPLCPG